MTNTTVKILSTPNNIETVGVNFFRNLGDGVKAAANLQEMVLSVVKSRDTTVLSKAMYRAEKEKNDTNASGAIRIVVGEVYPDAKLHKNKETGEYKITIKGCEADTNALTRLATVVEKGLSLRHATFRKTMKGDVEKPAFDAIKAAESFIKAHKNPAEVIAYIHALQAAHKAMAPLMIAAE